MDRYDVDHGEFDFVEQRRPRRRRRGWRIVRRTFGVLLLALLVLGILFRERVVAQYRAAVVLTTTTDAPVAAHVARWTTHEPTLTDATIAGTPVTIARPAGDGPWPTMIFITGADPKGRTEEHVQRLAAGLARAGILAIVPDLPGLADARVTPDTLDAGARLVTASARRSTTEDHRVSIASVSTGASIALLIAEQPGSARHIRSIAAIAPFADIRNALLLMTTGYYRTADGAFERYPSDPYLKRAITSSLREDLGTLPPQLDALLDNEDPRQFDALYAALPTLVRAVIEDLSPLDNAPALRGVHVEVATSTHDKYFPADESRALVAALPDAHLTVTDALDHAIPKFSRDSISDLLALDDFLLRAVTHATS